MKLAAVKSWAPWIVALVAVLGFLFTRGDRLVDQVAGRAASGADVSARIGATETWQKNHDLVTRPMMARFQKWERYQASFYQWMRMVSAQQGWPPPPNPDDMAVKDGTCGPYDEERAGFWAATP